MTGRADNAAMISAAALRAAASVRARSFAGHLATARRLRAWLGADAESDGRLLSLTAAAACGRVSRVEVLIRRAEAVRAFYAEAGR